jgi:hypothetical protein
MTPHNPAGSHQLNIIMLVKSSESAELARYSQIVVGDRCQHCAVQRPHGSERAATLTGD